MIVNEKVRQRFWSKVDIRSDDECWNWTGCVTGNGRSPQWSSGKTGLSISAPKTAYQLTKGDVPERQTVRHTCNSILCCNPNHLVLTSNLEARFWKKVDKTPGLGIGNCWIWKGAIESTGYGSFISERQTKVASHRFSLTLATGENPQDLFCLHCCDTPACVNPEHLRWGTPKENTQDAVTRNRIARGEKQGSARLTEKQVIEIKTLLASGCAVRELARRYNVGRTTIRHIQDGDSWKHIQVNLESENT